MSTVVWVFTVDGGLRAGWRWLAGSVITVLAVVAGALPIVILALAAYGGEPPLAVTLAGQSLGFGLAFLVATALCGLLLDITWDGRLRRGRLRGAGIGPPIGRALAEIVLGTLIGALALVPAVAIMAIGGVELVVPELDVQQAGVLVLVAVVAIAAAAWEEFFFRGYTFAWLGASLTRLLSWGGSAAGLPPVLGRRLAHLIGFGIPVLGSSLFFGIAHAGNPGANVLGFVNTFLAGLFLAVIVVRTRSLWAAIAAHWSWNVVHGLVLGLPVSGVSSNEDFVIPTLLRLEMAGPDWLGGGDYGVEGSVGATASMIVFVGIAALLPRRGRDQAMVAMIEPGDDSAADDVIEDAVTEEVTDDVPWGRV